MELPEGFRRIARDDSVQFTDGNLILYLSELVVSSPGGAPAPSAAELHERMRAKSAGQYDLAEDDQFGHARVEQVGDSSQLTAVREGPGSVLTLVASFSRESDLDVALRVWRSARSTG